MSPGPRRMFAWYCATIVLTLLALPSCVASLYEGHPVSPMRATSEDASVEIAWAGSHGDQFLVSIITNGPPGTHVDRAALMQPASSQCPLGVEPCTDPDYRFSMGTSARIVGDGQRSLLVFPLFGAKRELVGHPRLLVEVRTPVRSQVFEIDLARDVAFRIGDWGIGGAVRYRAPGLPNARFGDALTGDLGVDRWFGSNRVRLNYEIGLADCVGTHPSSSEVCGDGGPIFLLGGELSGTHYLPASGDYTLGVGLGYELLGALWHRASEPPDASPSGSFLHGPSLSLLLVPTAPRLPHFAPEPPKVAGGIELSFTPLFDRFFERPTFVAAIAWSYTAAN